MSPLYFTVFTLFSLWDYYIPAAGGRVLDYLALMLLGLSLLPRLSFGDWRPLAITSEHFLLLMTMSPLVVLGTIRASFLTGAAFVVGCMFVYAVFFTRDIDYGRLSRQLGWLIVVNLAAFYVQYATFKLSGYLINYHGWIGATDPRVLVGSVIRAGGLFQEPNGFCLTLLMLNAIRLFCHRVERDYLFPISIITLLLSESLWGIGAALFLIICKIYLVDTKGGRLPVMTLCIAGTAVIASTFVNWPSVLEFLFNAFTVSRLLDIANDPSAQARFSGSGGFTFDAGFFLGHGVSIEDFQSYLGVNAVSFYIYGFGLLGMLLFLLFLARASNGHALTKVLIVIFAMTTYPLFTYAFWWAWLAVLVKANSDESVRTGAWHFVVPKGSAYRPG